MDLLLGLIIISLLRIITLYKGSAALSVSCVCTHTYTHIADKEILTFLAYDVLNLHI